MRSSLLLCGTSEIALDDKGRLAVPARYREILKDECCGECVITRSLFDPCLWLYPKTEWEVAAAALSALMIADERATILSHPELKNLKL